MADFSMGEITEKDSESEKSVKQIDSAAFNLIRQSIAQFNGSEKSQEQSTLVRTLSEAI